MTFVHNARMRMAKQLATPLITALILSNLAAAQVKTSRATRGLQAIYSFEAGKGDVIADRSGVGRPLNLKIEKMSSVEWLDGALSVRSSDTIRSVGSAKKITDAVKRSGAITVEAWIKPASNSQSGPARVVSISNGPSERNVTLGQDGDRYDVRMRAGSTSGNGIPSTATSARVAGVALTHVVFTRDRSGNAKIYLNGMQHTAKRVTGGLNNWSESFRLMLANELSGDRPWLGELHLVAIFSQALTSSEVKQNFTAGNRVNSARLVALPKDAKQSRVDNGLLALYAFDAVDGDTIADRSGAGQPLNLKIENPAAIAWQNGALQIRSSTKIASARPATKITAALKRSGAATIEAWIKPDNIKQSGPARIVSLSPDTSKRNFTLGQDSDSFEVRFRTNGTDRNGHPTTTTPSGSATAQLTHVVYTRDSAGNTRIYLNGKQRGGAKVRGSLSNWVDGYRLVLANEATNDRPWLGTFYLAAIYGRSLRPAEVQQNYLAGAAVSTAEEFAQQQQMKLFETRIAPLLANKCLECHNSATKKGKLDLSRKVAALAGGESGKVIVPGNADDSLLLEQVVTGEMPPEGKPLTEAEKTALIQWVAKGANWSTDVIDPAIYERDEQGGSIWIQRLTVDEYIETVRVAVGVDIAKEAREILPRDLRADGFSNTAYNLNVDLKHVQAYARLAEIAVSRTDVMKFARRFSKSRKLSTDDTMRQFVASMGKWLFRGPLDEREVTTYSGIATTVASAGGNYEEAVGFIIEAMLQSPRFIYRIENQRGDGTRWPVGEFELASRMSFIIWGGPPDADLFRAAENGALHDRQAVEGQVRRMLEDPRAVRRSAQFATEWLDLNRLDNLNPSRKKYPRWNSELAGDMRAETLAFFHDIAWRQRRPLADLLNAQVTFATNRLAVHYGLEPKGEKLAKYDLSSTPSRGGLLTQGSILTIGGDDASMVTRGLFVLKDILRGTVKDPPPGLDTTPVPTKPGLSHRRISEQRIADAACGGCHSKFEPLAFGLEKFDGLGSFHNKDEHGNVLREDGEILFPGQAKAAKYSSAAELMDLLAANGRVRESITWKLTQFALGRPLTASDARTIKKLHDEAEEQGGTYASLITAIVTSDLVRLARTENQ